MDELSGSPAGASETRAADTKSSKAAQPDKKRKSGKATPAEAQEDDFISTSVSRQVRWFKQADLWSVALGAGLSDFRVSLIYQPFKGAEGPSEVWYVSSAIGYLLGQVHKKLTDSPRHIKTTSMAGSGRRRWFHFQQKGSTWSSSRSGSS